MYRFHRLLILANLLLGCTEVEYVLGAASTRDGGPLGPFNSPELLSILSDGGFEANNCTFTADLRELFFTSGRTGGQGSQDIWVSKRASANDDWGPPAVVTELNSPSLETSTGVAGDGLTLWFGSDRAGGLGKIDIWMASRADRESPWTQPVHVPELSSTDDDMAHPAMGSPLLMFLATRSLNPPEWDLTMATRADQTASFGTSTPITELNSSALDNDPFLSADGKTFFFNSNRVAANEEDLYQAARDPSTGKFSDPVPIVELNTTSRERDPWVSPDLRTMMFSSNRSGSYEIYQARR